MSDQAQIIVNENEKTSEVLDNTKLPFLADFDCCHTHPMMTLPIGCEVELNVTEKKVSIINDSFVL